MQVKKQQLEPDMEQQTGSKLGKEYVKAVYCHPAYLTYMQNTSCEMYYILWNEIHSVTPAEFSKFAGILSAALSQHYFLGFEIAHLEFHHFH